MMRKIILSLGLFIALMASLNQQNSKPVLAQSASEIMQLVNGFRTANGLPPFQINSALSVAAQNQANYMAANGIFSSHIGAGGSTPQSRANAAGYIGQVSENIVGGTKMSANQGLTWWRNSPVHYNTLITSRYIEAGTGFATNGSENFYVLVVGRPSDAPPANNSRDESPEPLFITPIVLSQPNEDGSIIHVVQEGQALWSLAAHYEVELSDLMLFNGLSDNALVRPGDEIIIRLADGQEPPPTPTPPLTYVVRAGDTAWSIAAVNGIKLTDFFWFNNFTEDTILQPGTEVIVHLAEGQPPPPTPTPIMFHIVRSGQTLWDIALTYGLTLDDLLAYNGLSADTLLQVGQELRIRPLPTSTLPPPATPEPTATVPEPQPAVMSAEVIVTAVTPTAANPDPTLTPAPLPTPTPESLTSPATSLIFLIGGLVILAGAFIIAGQRQN
ncbi:MAG: LysM peptidoglycan-binding domain-containing protein [Ardenticatenaceae bacterium]|nr:LysM peptidoglycan-binding domain-containing protein [Ardenticatenaceae bacterium]MCB9442646.1 LysM peptidoglycan-binding domain-containing protein [Ardenticatenaceae bacterium]